MLLCAYLRQRPTYRGRVYSVTLLRIHAMTMLPRRSRHNCKRPLRRANAVCMATSYKQDNGHNVMNGTGACLGKLGLVGSTGRLCSTSTCLQSHITGDTFVSWSGLFGSSPGMPVYELFCLARPQLPKEKMAAVIKTACTTVFNSKGVLTDVKSYDLQDLAYPIRQAGSKYQEVCPSFLKQSLAICMVAASDSILFHARRRSCGRCSFL